MRSDSQFRIIDVLSLEQATTERGSAAIALDEAMDGRHVDDDTCNTFQEKLSEKESVTSVCTGFPELPQLDTSLLDELLPSSQELLRSYMDQGDRSTTPQSGKSVGCESPPVSDGQLTSQRERMLLGLRTEDLDYLASSFTHRWVEGRGRTLISNRQFRPGDYVIEYKVRYNPLAHPSIMLLKNFHMERYPFEFSRDLEVNFHSPHKFVGVQIFIDVHPFYQRSDI